MRDEAKRKIIAVIGPTATGKTALGVRLARHFNGEIVSADSRQVYKGFDLGTGKDLAEYHLPGGTAIRHHLIDIASPDEVYNLMRFRSDAEQAITEIHARDALPIVVGGTALYLDALFKSYVLPGRPPDIALRADLEEKKPEELAELLKSIDPASHERLGDIRSRPRLLRAIENATIVPPPPPRPPRDWEWLVIGVYYHRSEVHKRIERRLDQRLRDGLIDEVETLHRQGLSWERLDFLGLEYRHISHFLRGLTSREQMRETLLAKIRRLARSQDIWFRKMEREGLIIHWLPKGDFDQTVELVGKFLRDDPLPDPEIRLADLRYGPKS